MSLKLVELTIENYRGIGSAPVSIKIDDIVVLIGRNNVGKTTILSAYEAFASTGGSLSLKDFHCENTDCIPKITGIFINAIEAGFTEKWILDEKESGYNDSIKVQYQWLAPEAKGEKHTYNKETGKFEKGGLGGLDSILTSRIPSPIKISPLDNPADLEKKILDILTSAIKDNVSKDSSKVQGLLDQIEALAKNIQQEMQEDINTACEQVSSEIQKVFPEYSQVTIDPKSGKLELEKIISSGSSVRISSQTGHSAPLSNHGTGLQRTFLWAALKMLAETGRHKIRNKVVAEETPKILLIEEPEAFLHPSAIKGAMESLYAIAKLDHWQIMTCTHSPGFIDLTKDHTTIIRIDKDTHKGHQVRTFSTDKAGFDVDDKENLKMLNFCNPYINEFFFSNRNVLVEGETEYTVIKALMQNSTSENKEAPHVINCFGKANIVTVAKILNHFSVNYYVIHDADRPYVKRRVKNVECYVKNGMWTENKKIFDEVEKGRLKHLTIHTFISIPNFEGEYLEGKTNNSKPYGAWKYFTQNDNESTQRFADILSFIDRSETSSAAEYLSYTELEQRVRDYVKQNGLTGDPLWNFDASDADSDGASEE